MENIKDFLQSFFDSTNERMKTPLVGAYVTSFIIYNWRPLTLLVFSDIRVECRIELINSYLNSNALLFPLYIALFYVLFLPWINVGIDRLLRYINEIKASNRNKKRIDILNQKKAEAKVEREIADERAGTSERFELQATIDRLTDENKKILEQNKDAFERYETSLVVEREAKNEVIENLKQLQSKLNNSQRDLHAVINNPYMWQISDDMRQTLSRMDEAGRNYYVSFVNLHVNKRTPGGIIDASYVDLYISLLLIAEKDSEYKLTMYGKVMYDYLNSQVPF